MQSNRHILKIARGPALIQRVAVWIVAFVLFNAASGYSQSRHDIEYRLKAVYLFNFLQFAEWPDSTFENERSPIILGVFGKDPFGSVLDEVIQNEKVGEHPIYIKRFQTMDAFAQCHAAFICLSERGNYHALLNKLTKSPTLTVSEIDGFVYLGGCIGFYLEDNKLRFEINMEALKQARVRMSSKLLRLANIIGRL